MSTAQLREGAVIAALVAVIFTAYVIFFRTPSRLIDLAVLGFLVFQIYALVRWRGAWRLVAALPGLGLGALIARIVIDVHRDPTAHNLWFLEILIGSVLGGIILGILVATRLAVLYVVRGRKMFPSRFPSKTEYEAWKGSQGGKPEGS